MSTKTSPHRFQRSPGWLLPVLVGILLLAAVLHFRGVLQDLPYHLSPDEPAIWSFVQRLRINGRIGQIYPPLRIFELAFEFSFLDLITPGTASTTAQYVTGRASTVLYTMLLIAVTYQAGRHLHNRAAGAAASLFLVAQPEVVQLANTFKTDNFAWLWGMSSLLLTFRVVRNEQRWLIAPAILAGIAAALSKFTMLSILIAPGLVLLLYVPRTRAGRAIAIASGLAAMIAGVLILLKPPAPLYDSFLSRHYVLIRLYQREHVLQFDSLGGAWPEMVRQIGQFNFWLVVLGMPLSAFVIAHSRLTRKQWLMLGAIAATIATHFILMGLFPSNRPTDRYLTVLGFALLWGTTVALLARRQLSIALVAALILTAPWLIDAWRSGTQAAQPDTRILSAEWFIANTPAGTHIAVEYDRSEFVSYGGFPGNIRFFVDDIDSIYDDSLETLAGLGIEYVIADTRARRYTGFFHPDRDDDNLAFLDDAQLILDMSDPQSQNWQGPGRYIFKIPPLQEVQTHYFLGSEIIFKGYDLTREPVMAGETLDLTLYWLALRETDANYIVFAHVLDGDGQLVTSLDGQPGKLGQPTYTWQASHFTADKWPVPIPADLSSGTYTLRIGMYDFDTQLRLPIFDSDNMPQGDSIMLGEIEVQSGS